MLEATIDSAPKVNFVTAPLTMEQIKEFFENKNVEFLVDYKNSQLKSPLILTYISNLDLPCEIYFGHSSKQEIFDLMKDYFQQKSIVHTVVLKVLAAQIILDSKGIDSGFLIQHEILTLEERKNFIKQNSEMIYNWNTFITSSLYGCLAGVKELEEKFNFKSAFPTVEDVHFVGYNIVNLFSVPGFVETYFSVPLTHPIKYFKPLFEDCLFKGKNFYGYFNHTNNLLGVILEACLMGKLPIEKVIEFINLPEQQDATS